MRVFKQVCCACCKLLHQTQELQQYLPGCSAQHVHAKQGVNCPLCIMLHGIISDAQLLLTNVPCAVEHSDDQLSWLTIGCSLICLIFHFSLDGHTSIACSVSSIFPGNNVERLTV